MAISMGAALLGSAVLGAGASMSASSKASKAAGKASDQNAAIQQQQYAQTRADLQPFAQTGYGAQSMLAQRLGIPSAPAANANANPFATPAGPAGNPWTAAGQPSAQAAPAASPFTMDQGKSILAERPDVANSEWLKGIPEQNIGDRTGDGQVTMEDRAAFWYDQHGKGEGYQLPTAANQTPATPPAPIPGQTMTSANNGGLGARQDFTRSAMPRPEFTEAQPEIGQGPQSADYLKNFETSPGYEFRLNQGIQGVNSGYAARGLLKSGGAMKGVNDYAQGTASSEYGNWFGQQMSRLGADQSQFNTDRNTSLAQYNQNRNVFNTNYNQDVARYDNNFNTDTGRYDANFNSDRGYNTDQYNNYTGNLFNLASMGASAAAGTANAGTNYANAMTSNNNNMASVKGNAAIAGANGINSAINTGMQAYGAYSNPFSSSSGGSGPINGVSYNVSPFGYQPSNHPNGF